MRSASGALITLLNSSREILVADLLTITQQNGTVTRLTSADFDIVSGGNTFSSKGPKFVRGRTKLLVGVQVDSLDVTLMPDPAKDLLGGLPWPAAAIAGALDEARVKLEKAFMASWGNLSAGTLIQFSGRVGEVTPSRDEIQLQVKSDLELLEQQMPRNVYQPGCVHTLYDTGCTLARAAFQISGTVLAGSTASSILATLAQASGYFELGTITFTSGVLSGLTKTVKTFTAGSPATIVPMLAFTKAPAAGDTFTIVPGCDKQQSTCTNKFANLAHFRGYPYVPKGEAVR